MCFRPEDTRALRGAVVAHANWVSGHRRKVEKLKGSGLWGSGDGRSSCGQGDATNAAWALFIVAWGRDYATWRVGRTPEAIMAELDMYRY